jgi:predicted metal-dependent peptidase
MGHYTPDFVRPSLYNPGLESAVIAIDVSGSMSPDDVAVATGFAEQLLLGSPETEVYVITCSEHVEEFKLITPSDLPLELNASFGGTSFAPVFDRIE